MPHYENEDGRVYITGMSRHSDYGDTQNIKTHLFDGDFSEPRHAMCMWAYDKYDSYSIFRGNISRAGICKICKRRADKNLDGVYPKSWDEEDPED